MQWSKLKQITEDKFAESIQGRVELFSTSYRKPRSDNGRGWITIDKEEIVNFATVSSLWNFGAYFHEATQTNCLTHPAVADDDRTAGKIIEDGEFSRFDLHNCCWEYLSLSVLEGLEHKSPIVNSLAVLDKRLGKRRLVTIDIQKLHPLPRRLLEFRLSVENLKSVQPK